MIQQFILHVLFSILYFNIKVFSEVLHCIFYFSCVNIISLLKKNYYYNITIDSTKNDTYNYVKEPEFVSDTFAEHDTNEINELRKSLKESLGVKSSENGK